MNRRLIDGIVDRRPSSDYPQDGHLGVRERITGEAPLGAEAYSYFRAQRGRLLALSALRLDSQFAVMQLSRRRAADERALTRCSRYLHSTRVARLHLRPPTTGYADADCARGEGRRSTTGGFLLARAPFLTWTAPAGAARLAARGISPIRRWRPWATWRTFSRSMSQWRLYECSPRTSEVHGAVSDRVADLSSAGREAFSGIANDCVVASSSMGRVGALTR